jgi:outer membrane lipoprotein SlyB
MEGQAIKSTHPLLIVAAVSVTLFSLVGIGAMLGWIPRSIGNQAASVPPVAQAPETQPAPEPEKPAASHPKPKHVAKAKAPVQVAEAPVPPPPPPGVIRPICNECGVIDSISEIKKEGQGSGAGAVGGGVIGGVLGHQVGRGAGKDLATVLGAVGGALAGNAIEKKAKTSSEYRIVVRFEDGSTRTYPSATVPGWRIGDKVKVIDGVIQANG